MLLVCISVPVSSRVLTLVTVSFLYIFPSYFRGVATVLDFVIYFFEVLPISFPGSFRLCYIYFISYSFLVVLWYSVTRSIFHFRVSLSERSSDVSIRAGLSSNGSSVRPSDSLSKLSLHLIPFHSFDEFSRHLWHHYS